MKTRQFSIEDHPHTEGVCEERELRLRWEEGAIAAAAGSVRLRRYKRYPTLQCRGAFQAFFRLSPQLRGYSVKTEKWDGRFAFEEEKMWSHSAEPKQVQRDSCVRGDNGRKL